MGKHRLLSSKDLAAIITAVIGVIGTITAAYFTFRSNMAPLEMASTATAVAANRATPVATLSTTTPESTVTAVTLAATATPLSPTPAFVFSTNCISSTIWTPYPASFTFTQENNCWNLSSKGIAAQDNKLLFAIQNNSEQSGSIYMAVPKTGLVQFKVKIDKFDSGGSNGNLAFGLSAIDNWLTSGEFIFFRTIDTGSSVYMVYGDSIKKTGRRTIGTYEMGSVEVITFDFRNLGFDIYLNDSVIASDIPLSSLEQQVFWIGYSLPSGSKVVASLSDFRIENR